VFEEERLDRLERLGVEDVDVVEAGYYEGVGRCYGVCQGLDILLDTELMLPHRPGILLTGRSVRSSLRSAEGRLLDAMERGLATVAAIQGVWESVRSGKDCAKVTSA
jgi:hypothetical protein